MAAAQISKLVPVDIRVVWPMEASGFTPWLLANAEALGEALGIDLELSAAEHKVGGYSLDLVGRDGTTDEIVIIENQFGSTDHRHLGQLLTYAGGTEPAIVVWIAESFRDEHRAALDWLNQRTDAATRFFGVQLGVVTIDGAPESLVAPLLDVVVKPNDWGTGVNTATAEANSDRERLYLEFWTDWLIRVSGRSWTNRKAQPRHFISLPSGVKRARYTVSFRTGGLMSELYFHHKLPAANLARWQLLASQRGAIESAFGGPLIFDELPARKGCRIGVQRDGGSIEIRDEWPDYADWFEDTQVRLRNAITAAGGVPPLSAVATEDDEGDDVDEVED